MSISPEYRRFQQTHYLDSSEREAGVSHLWHMQRLAEARLRSGKGIIDAPDVDFRHPEMMDMKQAVASALMTRLQRRVLDEEQRIVKRNKALYGHLLDVNNDTYRERRGMNIFPGEEELKKWYRMDQHSLALYRDRSMREAGTRKDNLAIMKNLVNTKPVVPSAKGLATWYHHDHKKRVRQLSRFKRSEPFSGANVLRKSCHLRLAGDVENDAAPPMNARKPFLWPQRKIPTFMETLHSCPLIPSLQEASETYVKGNLTLDTDAGYHNASTVPRQKRAEWKGISALDTTLMNYASDLILARGGDLPRVRRTEENSVTRLWRDGINAKYRACDRQKNMLCKRGVSAATTEIGVINADAETEGGGGEVRCKSRGMSSTSIRWNPDRWSSRTSVLTLIKRKTDSKMSRRRSLASRQSSVGFISLRDGDKTSSMRKPSMDSNLPNEDQSSFDAVGDKSESQPAQVDKSIDEKKNAEYSQFHDDQVAHLAEAADNPGFDGRKFAGGSVKNLRHPSKPFLPF